MDSKTNITNPESVLGECSNVKVKYIKYTEYGKMLEPHIENIKSMIDKSSNGEAVVSIRDIANIIDMDEKSSTAIRNGVKYIMWQHKIATDLGIHKDGISELLIFRNPVDGEKLPDSLARNKTNDIEYRNELAKRKGYKNSSEYKNGLAMERGFKDYNEYHRKMNYKNGIRTPFDKNTRCSAYFGIHIAERILPLIFKNVEKMPYNNPGYDYICNKGYSIDVKSSSLTSNNTWCFTIKKNRIADYFLIEAFDNRNNLNVMYIWLIKGNEIIGRGRKLNDRMGLVITNSEKYLRKLRKYEITDKLDDVQRVCNEFRKTN